MKSSFALKIAFAVCVSASTTAVNADTIALWTFETSVPTTAGPHTPEVGNGAAQGFHNGASTYSNPVGNGSAESFSSTNWLVGDYYEFKVSTLNFVDVKVSFDQTSSNTGPRDFKLSYSTNGTSFTDFADYSVLANASPNAWSSGGSRNAVYTLSFDLASVSAIENATEVFLRLIDRSTVSANGGTVQSGGTDRVDNFLVEATAAPVPVPAALWLLAPALGFVARRRAA